MLNTVFRNKGKKIKWKQKNTCMFTVYVYGVS